MMRRQIVIIAALMAYGGVNAQPLQSSQVENPIPSSGGALVMKKALPDPLEAGWERKSVCELLHENEKSRALRCTFPPGTGHEKHFHAPHFGYILEGSKMQITDGEGTRVVDTKSGATWWSDGTAWHEAVNVGDTTGVYIIVEPKGAGE